MILDQGKITIQKDHVVLQFNFDRDVIKAVKSIGMKWSPARKVWYAKITKLFVVSFLTLFPEFTSQLKSYLPKDIDYTSYVPSKYLMKHQKKAANASMKFSRRAFFHQIGTGKTLLSIELIKQKELKTLVICPLSIIEAAWINEIKKFAPELNAVNLWLLKKKNTSVGIRTFKQKLKECDVGIINFESFKPLKFSLEQAGFSMLIIDESARIKDHRSQITEKIVEFSENMDFVYSLSGNPAPNSELEYWSQIRIINPLLFGISFYSFRNKYFYSYGYGNFKWSMKEDLRGRFLAKLASVSEVVRKDDVLDLPEKTENIRKVFLSRPERRAYQEMKRHLVLEVGDKEVIAANAAVKLMKLREGTSGFYIDSEGDAITVGNSKLKELELLLDEIGNNQVIIWTHFHHEADQIEKMLSTKSFGRVDGTISSQEKKDAIVKDFIDGKIQYLISHPASLGHGVTLVNCTYMIYFSLSHSWELFDQSSGRIYRKGQTNKCSYYFLIADDSVDEVILKALEGKSRVVEAVFKYIKGENNG